LFFARNALALEEPTDRAVAVDDPVFCQFVAQTLDRRDARPATPTRLAVRHQQQLAGHLVGLKAADQPKCPGPPHRDPRLTIYRNDRNIGQTPNILAGIARASGKYVAIPGDDDLWDPSFVASLVDPMEGDSDVVVALCDHHIIDPQGQVDEAATDKVTRRFARHMLREGGYRPFDDIALIYRAICVVSGSLIRKSAIDWSHIPSDLPSSADIYIAYLLAVTGGKSWYTPRRLLKYRYHSGKTMQANQSRLSYATWMLEFWLVFLRDVRLRNHSYFKMVCARWATLILVYFSAQN
jgi:glycosyltransferase involved in cell wall biosynthesis